MVRLIVIASVILFVLILGGGTLLYLAYGLTESPPAALRVSTLQDSTQVEYFSDGSARIKATGRVDAFAALGYLHAQEHAWTMSLYRRAALGGLSEWFGDDLLEVDRLALRLGLSRGAREAYTTLSTSEQEVLISFASGVNAALQQRGTRMRHEFVALGVVPEKWEPWHTLSIERLYAWFAAERPDVDSLRIYGGELVDFFEADNRLRRLLHLHGFENGLAVSLQDSSGMHLIQRHVFGATALPLFQTVVMEWPGEQPLRGGTLIGTPYMPAGSQGGRAWGILLSSELSLQAAARDTTQLSPVFERVISSDGEEHLVRVDRSVSEIFLARAPAFFVEGAARAGPGALTGEDAVTGLSTRRAPALHSPDDGGENGEPLAASAEAGTTQSDATDQEGIHQGWVLRWSGFRTGSDAEAWAALMAGDVPEFDLFRGDGVEIAFSGERRMLGQPLVARRSDEALLVSNSAWSSFAADRLDSLVQRQEYFPDPENVIRDAGSAWAAALAPSLVERAIAVPNQPGIITEALAFLRNWDFAYDQASIAASIFDTWTDVYQDSMGTLPVANPPDTAHTETLLLYELLIDAVEELSDRHGEYISQWRWEDVQPHRYYFPVFSADTLLSAKIDALPRTRYAAVEVPGSGHPSSLQWGPSFVESDLPSPAHWEVTVSSGNDEAFVVRSRRFRPNRFFGRYLVSDRAPAAGPVAQPDRHMHTTLLHP